MKSTEVKETRYVSAVFRIHRKKDIEEIGFGKGEKYETTAFLKNLRKHDKKGVKTTRKFILAGHFKALHKGYPRGFIKNRTYLPEKEDAIFKDSRYHNTYVSEINILKGANRGARKKN